jgi:outer membrane protein assembly factor BamE (lipoprotein component of BamABCDE complex)
MELKYVIAMHPYLPSHRQRTVPRPSMWFGAMVVAPVVLGVVLIGKFPTVRNGVRRLVRKWPLAIANHPSHDMSLASLRNAIVGNGKNEIASVFGPPQAAAMLNHETWYYPLRSRRRWAMAISFDQERAREVEFFRAPV